jgi:hypothetical protein
MKHPVSSGNVSFQRSRRKKTEQTRNVSVLRATQSEGLDQSDLQRRQKDIANGKNTVGYKEYCQKISLDKREPLSMKHPATPDYSLKMSSRDWKGRVKAWCDNYS